MRATKLYTILPLLYLTAHTVMAVLLLAAQQISEVAAARNRIQVIVL